MNEAHGTSIIERFEYLRSRGYLPADVGTLLNVLPACRGKDREEVATLYLNDAVIRGDVKEIRKGRVLLEAAWSGDQERSSEVAEQMVADALLEAWRPAEAWQNFALLNYNGTAERYVKMFDVIGPDDDISEILQILDGSVLECWQGYISMTEALESYFEPMIVILELCGKEFDRTDPACYLAAFVSAPEGVSVPELLAAWETSEESRAGRWKALRALGAVPRAIADPHDYQGPLTRKRGR